MTPDEEDSKPLHRLLGERMNGFPIQPGKVQAPPLRDQTLARDRLLDWLAAKIHQRVVLVIADAGYGKTTLLADFSERTRSRMLWYRLDDDDRDWPTFLRHLIAAGREHDPTFAPTTFAMLSDLSMGGPDARSCDRRLPPRARDDHRRTARSSCLTTSMSSMSRQTSAPSPGS